MNAIYLIKSCCTFEENKSYLILSKQRKSPEFKICNDKQKFEKMNFDGGRKRRERR